MLKIDQENKAFMPRVKSNMLTTVNNRKTKKKNLCKEWNENVYEPIRDELNAYLSSKKSNDLINNRRQQYESYIQETNNRSLFIFNYNY